MAVCVGYSSVNTERCTTQTCTVRKLPSYSSNGSVPNCIAIYVLEQPGRDSNSRSKNILQLAQHAYHRWVDTTGLIVQFTYLAPIHSFATNVPKIWALSIYMYHIVLNIRESKFCRF